MRFSFPLMILVGLTTIAASQQPTANTPANAPQELTQGPVHEAFGEPILFNPQPGPIVAKQPPAPIDELPPEQKPEGENVIWIPGYWFWDDAKQDFIWVSGFWRVPPPGRTWVPGYWRDTGNGYQWVTGFWNSDDVQTAQYLPQPPESLEDGPSTPAPGDNYVWSPGCWIYLDSQYRWQPGSWIQAYADWTWVPSHYICTPSGYVFVSGYWDYPIGRRGTLFAPVLFPQGYLAAQRNFVYTPSVVLASAALLGNLFVRPNYSHYYFGDYYGANELKRGFYPAFSYHNSHFGYDPIFAHSAWVQGRQNKEWLTEQRNQYWSRRENEAARPAHTFAEYQRSATRANVRTEAFAHTLNEETTRRNAELRYQNLNLERRREYAQHANFNRTLVENRAQFEHRNATTHEPKVEPKVPERKVEPRVPERKIEPKAPERKIEATHVQANWQIPRAKAQVSATQVHVRAPEVPRPPAHNAKPPEVAHPLPHPEENLRRPEPKRK